ncbi:PIN-like domain-containing protein [Priestia megaterium]
MFAGLIDYNAEDYEELWSEAIFVVDTNILINFYKFTSKDTTSKLFEILTDLKSKGRLWIPHQVALEYFFNYQDNLNKPREGYNSLGAKVSKITGDIKTAFGKIKTDYSYINTEEFEFIYEDLKTSNKKFQEKVQQEIKKLPDPTVIKDDIYKLLDGIVGEPYDQQKIDDIEKKGEYRYKNAVPPGFKDEDKDKNEKEKLGSKIFGNIQYQRKYGDLILWNQIIDHINQKENPTPVIFITEDRKEDWWEKENTNIKRPHPLLLQEFMQKTKQKFYIYRTDIFVKYANEFLDANVSADEQESINRDVNNIRHSTELEEKWAAIFGEGVWKHKAMSDIKKYNEFKKFRNNIFGYLHPDDSIHYLGRFNDIDNSTQSPNNKLVAYNALMDEVFGIVIPNMFESIKNLIRSVEKSGIIGAADKALDIINNLPEDDLEKAKILDATINDLRGAYDWDYKE